MLKFETILTIAEHKNVVEQRAARYFAQQGYRAKQDRTGRTYYERGSVWHNYMAFNPGSWHVFVYITTEATSDDSTWVDVRMDVDTQGQIVLDRERHYWETEFDVLTGYLETGKTKHQDILGDLGRHNEQQNIALTVGMVAVSALAILVLMSLFLGLVIR